VGKGRTVVQSKVWWVVACGGLLWGCEGDGTTLVTLPPPQPDASVATTGDASADAADTARGDADADAARDAATEDSSIPLDDAEPLVCSPLECSPSCLSQQELVSEVTRRCSFFFARGVTEGTACDASFVRYEYGASDVAIVFFDSTSGEMLGSWNRSDTAEQTCAGSVDPECAFALHRSLPDPDDEGCPPDAGADAAVDSGSLGVDGG
jgi:hypothetical protein